MDDFEAYADEQEFLKDLQFVFKEDYGILIEGEDLKEAGHNIDALLNAFMY